MSKDKFRVMVLQARYDYLHGEPSITDAEYDTLLNMLDEDDPIRTRIYEDDSEDIDYPKVNKWDIKTMVSSSGEIPEFLMNIFPQSIPPFRDEPRLEYKVEQMGMPILISQKIDGLSFIAYYKDGKYIGATSRGRGTGRHNYSKVLKLILPEKIERDGDFVVRGEVFVLLNSLEKLREQYSSLGFIMPRTSAMSLIMNPIIKEDDIKKYLKYVAFDIMHPTTNTNKKDKYSELNKLGFNIPLSYIVNNIDEMYNTFDTIAKESELSNIMTDGVVIENYTSEKPEQISAKVRHWESVIYSSKVKEISYKSCKTKVTVSLEVEPVQAHDGVTIRTIIITIQEFLNPTPLQVGDTILFERKNNTTNVYKGRI